MRVLRKASARQHGPWNRSRKKICPAERNVKAYDFSMGKY